MLAVNTCIDNLEAVYCNGWDRIFVWVYNTRCKCIEGPKYCYESGDSHSNHRNFVLDIF